MIPAHPDPQPRRPEPEIALQPPAGIDERAWRSIARPEQGVWLIDEREADGSVVGTTERHPDGSKKNRPGGKRGLIVPDGEIATYAGSSLDDPVLIAEGATDTAALFQLGFDVVGTPMAGHCGEWLSSVLADRHAVIVADADDAGRRGAAKLARAIAARCASVRIIEPPGGHKDARAAAIAGEDAEAFRAAIAEASVYETPRSDPASEFRGLLTPERIAEFVPFPTDQLPEPIRSFVVQGARAIGCDEALIAPPILAALGAAIGTTHRLQLKAGWLAPPALWCAIVGESGTHKSPALSLATDSLRAIQSEALAEHERAMDDYTIEAERHAAAIGDWRKHKGERGDPPEAPERPHAHRFVVSDTTVEGLVPILQHNPRGVLLERDELAGWFGGFDRYTPGGKGGDSAHWLSMFDGRSLIVDRKTGDKRTLFVPNALVSIAGGIQPGILRRIATPEHRESGMIARFLVTMPPRRPMRWSDAELAPSIGEAVAGVFRWLLAIGHASTPEAEARPWIMHLDPDARRLWIDFYNQCGEEHAQLSGDDAAAFSKIIGYAPRLALVHRMTREAAGDTTTRPAMVDAESIRAGIALARWFSNEARRVYAVLDESDAGRETRLLVELIRRDGGEISGRELVHRSRMFKTVADAEAALSGLVEAGAGSWVTPQQRGPGRPKAQRFVLSPVYSVNDNRNTSGDAVNANTVDDDGPNTSPNTNDGGGEP